MNRNELHQTFQEIERTKQQVAYDFLMKQDAVNSTAELLRLTTLLHTEALTRASKKEQGDNN